VSAGLPLALRAALDRELEGVSRNDLAARAARTSAAYRAGGGSAGVIRHPQDALAYALVRLPATYAACAAVFGEARRAAPAFSPASLLDAGAGPGGASWAAAGAWPEIEAVAWADSSRPFLDLARRLAAQGPPALAAARPLPGDLARAEALPRADLVAASYALAEIPPPALPTVVDALWAACDGLLAVVEPGTPAGFARIVAVRERLAACGARLLAPCPHAGACPLAGPPGVRVGFPGWCHFGVRLPRSRDHRLAKAAEAPFEDEKFAYLLAARPGVAAAPAAARVLAPPRAGKAGVSLALCTRDGLEARAVARRDKAGFAAVRRLGWGDALD
jgi:ribosomal protein RSM22 (predicted rRNA methylase)